jgi:hypothetical protein
MLHQTHTYNNQSTHNNQPKSTMMPQLSSWNLKVGRLFKKWMDLHKWRLFKFALGEDPFDVFYILAEQEAKCQFKIEEHSMYLTTSRAN